MNNYKPRDFLGKLAESFDFGKQWSDVRDTLAGVNEVAESERRDEWGNWDYQHDVDPLAIDCPSLDLKFRSSEKKQWPYEAPFVLCVTHDIDSIDVFSWLEYWTRFKRASLFRKVRIALGFFKNKILLARNARWSFQKWLEIETRFGATATWFVFPDSPLRPHPNDCSYRWHQSVDWSRKGRIDFRTALNRLVAAGHEIGLHASINAAIDSDELRQQRRDLSAVIGRDVKSLRMHYLSYDPARSPAAIEAAGFTIDSTVGFNRGIGFRRRTSFPFRLFASDGNRVTGVWEVPLIVQEGALFRDWCLDLSLQEAKDRVTGILNDIESVNGVLTVVFHPDGIGDPKIEAFFEWLLSECSKRKAWMPTLSEVIDSLS